MLEDVLKKYDGVEVSPMEAYIDIFKLGDGFIQNRNEEPGEYKANPIGYWKNEKDQKGHFRVLFDDTFEETLKEMQAADFALLNGISYFGRRRDQNHASKMYAMIFDLDDVTDETLNNFVYGALVSDYDIYPLPNYIALSGNNVHLYYVFERPIPLFPNLKMQLKAFKYALTEKIWNGYTSKAKTKQKQGIFQPFRVLGGKTKPGSKEDHVRVFLMNTHPHNLDELGEYIPDEFKVDEDKLFKESKMSLSEAEKKYPEWYEKVIVNKDRTPKKWDIQGKVKGDNPTALYDWWLDNIKTGAVYTHRYFCVMCLVIYGVKCSVPYEKVKQDAYDLVPFLNDIKPEHPFTEADVDSALECYDDRYCTFPIRDIESVSAIQIKRNKRNGQSQRDHLEEARAIRDVRMKRQGRKWTDGNGRPVGSGTKEEQILKYMESHPGAKVSKIAADLGISRTTVYKYIKGKDVKPVKDNYDFDYVVEAPDGEKILVERETIKDFEKQRKERLLAYYKKLNEKLENGDK